MNPCLAIPIYDHERTVGAVVASLEGFDLPCVIVDDGSGNATHLELERLAAHYPWVEIVRHERNLGRGAALRTAYRTAAQRGMTHVIQLDADGQHDAADVERFLQAARSDPDALVLGTPKFDESVPLHRLHGRKLSRVIVWIETLSTAAKDPLCGFRCIPLARTLPILDGARTGDRMDFDPELVIRLVRDGVPVVNIETAVRYPEGGVSHFRMLNDNLLIAWAYIRLAFEIPWRHGGVRRNARGDSNSNWTSVPERGSRIALRILVWVVRRSARLAARLLLAPIALYYTLFAGNARRASQAYLARIHRARGGRHPAPGFRDTYHHFYSFAEVILDRLKLWAGADDDFDVVLNGQELVSKYLEAGRGVFMVGAHLGSFDMLRLIARDAGIPVNVLMFNSNSERINDTLQELDPNCSVRIIDIDQSSNRTAFEIRRCLKRGEFVAVLADRTLPGARDRTVRVDFFGRPATFPSGPFLISMAMRTPMILTVALRTGPNRYDVFFEEIADGAPVRVDERRDVARQRVAAYAARLEHYCGRAPLQWFNFYDFWADG